MNLRGRIVIGLSSVADLVYFKKRVAIYLFAAFDIDKVCRNGTAIFKSFVKINVNFNTSFLCSQAIFSTVLASYCGAL